MPDQINSAGRPAVEPREPVRIHTSRIEDACIDKDCIEDLRVYLTGTSQQALEGAVNARARSAELLHVYIDVSPIAYNPGHFTADLTFFYRVGGEAMSGVTRPAPLEGLAIFTKRVVLFGGQTATKVFSSPVLNGGRQLYVTLGQFSTVRMERGTQLLVPAVSFAMPDRSCSDDPGTPDEPCDLFAKVDFPTQAFYPSAQ